MKKFILQESAMVAAVILLALPMMMVISAEVYHLSRGILWLIFWYYLFRSYRIDRRWMMLFALPVVAYNPIYPMQYAGEIWGLINGFFFVIAIAWLLKRWRAEAGIITSRRA